MWLTSLFPILYLHLFLFPFWNVRCRCFQCVLLFQRQHDQLPLDGFSYNCRIFSACDRQVEKPWLILPYLQLNSFQECFDHENHFLWIINSGLFHSLITISQRTITLVVVIIAQPGKCKVIFISSIWITEERRQVVRKSLMKSEFRRKHVTLFGDCSWSIKDWSLPEEKIHLTFVFCNKE